MEKVIIDILLLSDGKDKILKTAQYTLKLIIWGLTFKKKKNEVLNRTVQTLQKSLSDGRRLFRMGNWIAIFKEVRMGPDFQKHWFLMIVTFMSKLCVLFTTLADDIGWCYKYSGSPNPIGKKISQRGDMSWTFSILLDLIPQTNDILKNYSKEVKLKQLQDRNGFIAGTSVDPTKESTSKDLEALYNERFLFYMNQVKLLVDLPIATTYGFNLDTNPGIIAICGLISSFIGLYKTYRKVKK